MDLRQMVSPSRPGLTRILLFCRWPWNLAIRQRWNNGGRNNAFFSCYWASFISTKIHHYLLNIDIIRLSSKNHPKLANYLSSFLYYSSHFYDYYFWYIIYFYPKNKWILLKNNGKISKRDRMQWCVYQAYSLLMMLTHLSYHQAQN